MGQITSTPERVQAVRDKLPEVTNNPANSNLLVSFHEEENIGKRKKEQQDAHGHLQVPADRSLKRPACYLFVVADGVSMGQAGALASRTAVDVILEVFQQRLDEGLTDFSQALVDAFAAGNLEVFRLARTRQGMATTCIAAVVCGQTLITAHVGDSRIYLSRQDRGLMQLTVDHSWVAEIGEVMVKQGLMTEDALQRDSRRHTITRAFGLEEEIQADINAANLQPGDTIVLCTDGLWDLIPEEDLEDEVEVGKRNLPGLSHNLVGEAMAAGGRDNITLTLVRIDQTDRPVNFPALPALLDRTSREVADRTRPLDVTDNRQNFGNMPQPTPRPANSTNLPPRSSEPPRSLNSSYDNNEVAAQIDDTPSMKLPIFNPEMLLSKAQKSFALGDWDKAIDFYIEVELAQASYHGLFESFSNAIIRYVGIAIGEGQVEAAESLVKHLENNHITRYNEALADYCNEESRRAATAFHYPASKAYAQFCLRLRPNDVRARNLSELADLYLNLQKPRTSLSERLAVAQKIYARDENYGKIQDDMAKIYMELGDDASRQQNLEDATGWYSMIMNLKPDDSRILSLASNKLRAAKDDLTRRPTSATSQSTPLSAPVNPPLFTQSPITPNSVKGINVNSKPELDKDMINRLKDRVSRAQKAWDSGRKEIGSEYISLVEQLNEQLTPNPWQQTLPRVCYDYGKWLLDQRQYDEARPYFLKAQLLGMAAAQQRLKEVDRLIKEKATKPRGTAPLDLPDPLSTATQAPFSSGLSTGSSSSILPDVGDPKSGDIFSNLTNAQPLFTPRRSEKISGPLIPPKPEMPSDGIFMGKSRSPETNPNPTLDSLPTITNSTPPLSVPPRSAAVIAAGTWRGDSEEPLENPLIGQPGENTRSRPVQDAPKPPSKPPLTSTGGRSLGGIQNRGDITSDMTLKAQMEMNRGKMRISLPNEHNTLRRKNPAMPSGTLLGQISGMILPGLVIGIIILALIIVWQVVVPKFSQNTPAATPTTSAVLTATKGGTTAPGTSAGTASQTTSAAASTSALTGVQGIVRIEGVNSDQVVVFLATSGDVNSPYRQLTQEANIFRLPVTTLNRLDPAQKYIVVVRPKDTNTKQYAENLSPDNPSQKPFISPEITYDPTKGFDTTMRITSEMMAFYPLKGSDTDSEANGVRYIGATHHSLGSDFLAYYNANGGLGRFGFPISEEFDWTGNGHVQFFERAWLTEDAAGKTVSVGKISRALLDSPCSTVVRLPSDVTPLAVPTLKADPAFAAFADQMKLGMPQSQVFDGPNKLKIQYFDTGRLELDTTTDGAKPMLGLLGSEYARCSGWLK